MKEQHRRVLLQLTAINKVTFQELLREKVLWSALLFAFACVGLAFAVSQLSFIDNARIAMTFGLTSISLVGGLIAVIMGANLIAKEVQNRTIYLVLTKAVWRWQLVLGRFGGLVAILVLNALLMTLVVLGVYLALGGSLHQTVIQSLLLQLAEFAILSAVACVFSSFSMATLAAIFASGVWVIGHAMADLRLLADKIEPLAIRPLLKTATFVLPDLTRFDIKAQVAHQLPVSWGYVSMSMLYAAAYVAFALVVACFIFTRRDL